MKNFKIGIDIGGTNTDIVLVDSQEKIVYCNKTTTTDPVDKGVANLLEKCLPVKDGQVSGVFVGTTHAVNAILQRKDLFKVGVIRLTSGAGNCVEPCCGWPQDLKDAVLAGFEVVDGGYYCDGREIAKINHEQVKKSVRNLLKKGAQSFAIIGTYSPIKNDQELEVVKIIKTFCHNRGKEFLASNNLDALSKDGDFENALARDISSGDIPVCVSCEIGGTGFIERENATILNAALKKCMARGFNALESVVRKNNLTCPIFITQNNGTIISIKDAIEYPILTISSGPTNSFVGAVKLANLQNAVIADIGGTSTDVGIVNDGFARRSLANTNIGGISLNFPMPDVLSVGIGGGSYICVEENESGEILIGPESAGRKLLEHAKCFGGQMLTLTDIAVSAGLVTIEGADASRVAVSGDCVCKTVLQVKEKLIQMHKMISGKNGDIQLVLVGGGAALFKESEIAKICIIPECANVANAYGAALAEVSGSVDTVVKLDNRQDVLDNLISQASQKAIENGAKEETLRLVDKQILPFSYVPGNFARVKITVVGKKG